MIWQTELETVAFSAGPFVVTGRYFYKLPRNEQLAIIAHERGHIFHRHQLKRLWWVVSLQWAGIAEKCRLQEYQADRYAVRMGHGKGLISFLKRIGPHENPLHPTPALRINVIQKWTEEWKTTAPSARVDPSP